jgi:HTH-type transcriptional regulator/antitoxin HigA
MIREVGKMSAVPSADIDAKKYSRLLAKTLPRSIRSEKENERVLKIVERLIDKGEANLTTEEGTLLDLLVTLVEKFEEERYQLERNSSATPLGILKELMAARNLKSSDLWRVLGSKGLTSEILSGKRAISKSRAKALAEFFHVSADLFI